MRRVGTDYSQADYQRRIENLRFYSMLIQCTDIKLLEKTMYRE